jgi:hypothetical protein
MTGGFGPPTHLSPEPFRPAPLDGPLPDVLFDTDLVVREFVVDWQVAERAVISAAPSKGTQPEILFP